MGQIVDIDTLDQCWTSTVLADAPYVLARRFSTLDHLTKGRVAFNIVTSYLDSAARNFGLKHQMEHDERYRRAEEYMK
jgi:alkanesulfonate monooxygenase SsuD/methylene tetrahydromethanopterin reductase-like flavin-dependent oxidoreductase (luciferase family)